jgi:type IV secretory pathway protease TraF
MMPHAGVLALTGLGVAFAIASSLVDARPILIWNATASAPRGLYRITPPTALQAGDLVLLRPIRRVPRCMLNAVTSHWGCH